MSLRGEEKRGGSESEGSCDAGRSIEVVYATWARWRISLGALDIQKGLWSISLRVRKGQNLIILDRTRLECRRVLVTKSYPDVGSFCYRDYVHRSASMSLSCTGEICLRIVPLVLLIDTLVQKSLHAIVLQNQQTNLHPIFLHVTVHTKIQANRQDIFECQSHPPLSSIHNCHWLCCRRSCYSPVLVE
jgi:hypothetical protein